MSVKPFFFSIVSTIFLATSCSAANLAGPADIVKEYCRRELEGVRLKGGTWDNMSPLIEWAGKVEPPDNPVVIVSSYRVTSSVRKGKKATVTAEFTVVGIMDGAEQFVPKRELERVTFQLQKTNIGWQILSPIITPHVSPTKMRQHIRELLESDEKEGFTERKAVLQRVIAQLDALPK